MIVTFKPAKTGALRRYHSQELTCEAAGEYEVSEELAAQLCADFPANFTAKKGGSKSAGPPSHNRAASPPGKNR